MNKYWIRPIPLCHGYRNGSNWTYLMNSGRPSSSCAYVWYIEGPEAKILVDAGCKAEFVTASVGAQMEDIQSLDEGLSKLGLRPKDIEIVILTHLHGDHVQLAPKFVRAKFIVQRAELDFALNPHPMVVKLGEYNKMFFEDINVEIIEGDKEIIDGVSVILTPGHTPGGQSVVVETPRGKAIITGFCCTLDNFNPTPEVKAKGFEVLAPTRHYDVLQAYDSALKIKQSGHMIVPLHESAFISRDRLP